MTRSDEPPMSISLGLILDACWREAGAGLHPSHPPEWAVSVFLMLPHDPSGAARAVELFRAGFDDPEVQRMLAVKALRG